MRLSNTLLVSNNTNSETINAFHAITGALAGTARDRSVRVVMIDQLWAIDFGDGVPNPNNGPANQLFFTAGPDYDSLALIQAIFSKLLTAVDEHSTLTVKMKLV